jgi:hypothetical protein
MNIFGGQIFNQRFFEVRAALAIRGGQTAEQYNALGFQLSWRDARTSLRQVRQWRA